MSAKLKNHPLVDLVGFRFLALVSFCLLILPNHLFAQNSDRHVVLISDLHMGVGRTDQDSEGNYTEGVWHHYEDFRWHDEFELFIDALPLLSDRKSIDLVIVGDFLELWQSDGRYCGDSPDATTKTEKNSDLGCTQAQALHRLDRIVGAHKRVFSALGKFASSNGNKIHILPGNHDAALVFELVAQRVIHEIGAPDGRTVIYPDGFWIDSKKTMIVEHGHQIDGDINQFKSDKSKAVVCRSNKGRVQSCSVPDSHLQRSSGENFVQKYYNEYEDKFSIIDNLAKESLGVSLALKASSFGEKTEAITNGFKFFLFQQSISQVFQTLGPDDSGVIQYDYDAVRQLDKYFSLNAFDEPIRSSVDELMQTGQINVEFSEFDDDEIDMLCSKIEALAVIDTKIIAEQSRSGEVTWDQRDVCPRVPGQEDLGGIISSLLFSRNHQLRKHLRRRSKQFEAVDFSHFIYGHTHKAESELKPFERGRLRPVVFNTGAWQRTANPEQLYKIIENRGLTEEQALECLTPEDLPACYTFVTIGPYAEKPNPILRYWAFVPEVGRWRSLSSCPEIRAVDAAPLNPDCRK